MKLMYEDKILSQDIDTANTFMKRLRGLMFFNDYQNPKGLFFPHCAWIHTFFMLFDLDILYLDADFRVVGIKKKLKAWRLTMPSFKAVHTLEFKAGFLERDFIYDRRSFKCIDFFV